MLSIVAVTTKIQLGGETSTDKPLIFKPGSNVYKSKNIDIQTVVFYPLLEKAKILHPVLAYRDRYGILWVWGREGIIGINGKGGYISERKDIEATAMLCTVSGETWLGCRAKGNLVFGRNEIGKILTTKEIKVENSNIDDLKNTTNVIFEDSDRNIWLGTRDGLYMIPPTESNSIINIRNDINVLSTPSHSTICGVYSDSKNNIWLATSNGLNKLIYNEILKGEYTIERYYDNRSIEDQIINNKLECIVEDDNGILWIGTKEHITLFDPSTKRFRQREEITKKEIDYGLSFVRSLCKDSDGNIWAGYSSNGLAAYFKDEERFAPLTISSNGVSLDNCTSITFDKQGVIWASDRHKGLFSFRIRKPVRTIYEMKHYPFSEYNYGKENQTTVTKVYADRNNTI